jgi:hypothetical protein
MGAVRASVAMEINFKVSLALVAGIECQIVVL